MAWWKRRSAEYGVKNSGLKTLLLDYFGVSLPNSQKITTILFSKSNRLAIHPFLFETLKNSKSGKDGVL